MNQEHTGITGRIMPPAQMSVMITTNDFGGTL